MKEIVKHYELQKPWENRPHYCCDFSKCEPFTDHDLKMVSDPKKVTCKKCLHILKRDGIIK
jgi:hypothetical protein